MYIWEIDQNIVTYLNRVKTKLKIINVANYAFCTENPKNM